MPAATSAASANTNMKPPKTAKKIAPIGETARHRAGPDQARRHECVAAPALHARLPPPEGREHRDTRRQHRPRPPRPAGGAALGERQDDQDDRDRQQCRADHVHPLRMLGARLRHPPQGEEGSGHQRYVEPEGRAPAEPGRGRPSPGRPPTDEARRRSRSPPSRRTTPSPSPGRRPRSGPGSSRAPAARPRAAPSPWATRAATSRPADGARAHHTEASPEPHQPDPQHPAPAEVVTQPAAEHDRARVGHAEGGDHELEDTRAGVQLALQRSEGHGDDEEVEDLETRRRSVRRRARAPELGLTAVGPSKRQLGPGHHRGAHGSTVAPDERGIQSRVIQVPADPGSPGRVDLP